MTGFHRPHAPALLVALAAVALGAPAAADQCINDDLIVDGSACIGFDCVCNAEVFSLDTLRLKENNLRITFIDTSSTASFPRGDWQIRANDSVNGGANKFTVDWLGTGVSNGSIPETIPFTIEGTAPTNSLYVDDGGRIGFGTAVPSVELHSRDGDTPTLRLQQDGSAGFEPQTWDVAGNETNFFVRDVTNGSALPLRIRPGAPSNSIFVDTDGDVGVGTGAPGAGTGGDDAKVHIRDTGGNAMLLVEDTQTGADDLLELRNAGNTRLRVTDTDSASETWTMVFSQAGGGGGQFTMNENGANVANELTLNATGDLTVRGNLFSAACVSPTPCGPDYVFEPDYQLMPLDELKAFVTANKHLPNVPSAAEMVGPINVNSLQMRLLEKIEELMLYTFEQQAALEELRAANAALAERLAALELR